MFRKSLNTKYFHLFLLTIAGTALLLINLNKPFVGFHDFNNVQYGTIVQNYRKFGIVNLKFGQLTGKIKGGYKAHRSFYTSYLPLLPVLVSGSVYLLGIHEWSIRLVPLIFSVTGVIFFYLLIAKIWGFRTGIIASFFYILNPMFIYFGNMAVVDVLVLPVMVVSFYFYYCWIQSGQNRYYMILCISLVIGCFIAWITAYLIPLFFLHFLMIRKSPKPLIIPALLVFLTVGLQLVHAQILTGNIGSGLFKTLQNRIAENNLSFGGKSFSYLSYARQEVTILQAYFTRILLVLSFIGLLFCLKSKNSGRTILVLFLVLGFLHPVIFARAVFIHDYHNIYFLPFFAAGGALAINMLMDFLRRKKAGGFFIAFVLTAVFGYFAFERIDFSKTLLNTDMNKPGFNMAVLLNKLQQNDGEAAVVSSRFGSFYGLFTSFYSKYNFAVIDEETLGEDLGRYKYIIMIDEDIRDKSFYNFLLSKYRYRRINDWTVIYEQ